MKEESTGNSILENEEDDSKRNIENISEISLETEIKNDFKIKKNNFKCYFKCFSKNNRIILTIIIIIESIICSFNFFNIFAYFEIQTPFDSDLFNDYILLILIEICFFSFFSMIIIENNFSIGIYLFNLLQILGCLFGIFQNKQKFIFKEISYFCFISSFPFLFNLFSKIYNIFFDYSNRIKILSLFFASFSFGSFLSFIFNNKFTIAETEDLIKIQKKIQIIFILIYFINLIFLFNPFPKKFYSQSSRKKYNNYLSVKIKTSLINIFKQKDLLFSFIASILFFLTIYNIFFIYKTKMRKDVCSSILFFFFGILGCLFINLFKFKNIKLYKKIMILCNLSVLFSLIFLIFSNKYISYIFNIINGFFFFSFLIVNLDFLIDIIFPFGESIASTLILFFSSLFFFLIYFLKKKYKNNHIEIVIQFISYIISLIIIIFNKKVIMKRILIDGSDLNIKF